MSSTRPKIINSPRFSLVPLCVALLTIAFTIFVRARLLNMPLERDEGEYAYAGQLMLQGIPPYKLAYNMKLPGTYAAYAIIMAGFGQTSRGIHLGLILVNFATSGLIYFLGRSLCGRIAGCIAAGCFALLSLSPSVLGLAAHATHFVTFFAVAGALCLWLYLEGRQHILFWSGVLFGTAFLMKQQAIFFPLFGLLTVFWHLRSVRKTVWLQCAAQGAIFCGGAMIPFAITCVALAASGVFQRFWFWSFSYASKYATTTSVPEGLRILNERITNLISSAPLLWLILFAAAIFTFAMLGTARSRTFLAGLLVTGFATCCPGLYFREHYFIPLLVPLGLALGVAVEWVWNLAGGKAYVRMATVLVLLFAAAQLINKQAAVFFRLSPEMACRYIYSKNPFPEAVRIADYIREHTANTDTVAVIGSEPEIYFYAHRHSATGYIYTYPLMEPQVYASKMQREMISEIEAAQPAIIVLVNVATSWLKRPSSDQTILNWSLSYGSHSYEPCLLVDLETSGTAFHEHDSLGISPRAQDYVWVERRRGLPQ
jgi:hypothetical protein